jgi:hypothetical protein
MQSESSLKALLNQKTIAIMKYWCLICSLNAEEAEVTITLKFCWTFNSLECRKDRRYYSTIGTDWCFQLNGYGRYMISPLMNTYDSMWPLVPMVRYDQRYTCRWKWMHWIYDNAIKFSCHMKCRWAQTYEQSNIPKVIAYEGLIKNSHLKNTKI